MLDAVAISSGKYLENSLTRGTRQASGPTRTSVAFAYRIIAQVNSTRQRELHLAMDLGPEALQARIHLKGCRSFASLQDCQSRALMVLGHLLYLTCDMQAAVGLTSDGRLHVAEVSGEEHRHNSCHCQRKHWYYSTKASRSNAAPNGRSPFFSVVPQQPPKRSFGLQKASPVYPVT